MGKVISFELKKLVSRIGLYILVLFLAGLLVMSMFMYKPEKITYPTASLNGETVQEMYSDFASTQKDIQMTIFNSAVENANSYSTTSNLYNKCNSKQYITDLFSSFDIACGNYKNATEPDSLSPDEYNILLNGVNTEFDNLKSALEVGLEASNKQTGYYILTSEDNYTAIYTVLNSIKNNFEAPPVHRVAANKYYTSYRAELMRCLDNLIYPNLNKVAESFGSNSSYALITSLRMEEIEQKMADLNAEALGDSKSNSSSENRNKLNTLYNRYVNCAEIFSKAYYSNLGAKALGSVKSKTDRSHLRGYSQVSVYDLEETALEYEYYIQHNSSASDYARSLSVTHTSNTEINAYDFTYYAISIFTIIVVIFAVYLASNSIAGEINSNTMRFTAVRPVKRGSIFFGKYFSILIISLLLLVFGTATSFIVGTILYGANSANILMIINGYYIASVHPALALAIFVASQFVVVAFYSAIALLLSSILKSDILALIISAIFYVFNLILPVFFNSTSWLRFYPPANINLFAYFSSSRLTTDTVLGNILNPVIYQGMNLWISIAYALGISIVILLIGKAVFKRREL